MNTTRLLMYQGEALLPAIAYGDAAGLPVEARSAQYIAANYGRITKLIPTAENPYFTGLYAPGYWSDDTQLSIAVAKGLIAADGFDLEAQVAAHLDAYEQTPMIVNSKGVQTKRGWGGSTVNAMEKLKQGVSPLESGTVDGSGNGVLMKMAPLAYWQYVRDISKEQRHKQYDQLTTMTHDSDIARLATRIHGDVLHSLLIDRYDRLRLLKVLKRSIEYHEAEVGMTGEVKELFSYLRHDVDADAILTNTDGKGFYAPQTLAMAYGAFIAQEAEFIPSVYEAVNLGGDTDSTASIVAAMSTFATKEVIRMKIDHQNLDQLAMLKEVSGQLAARALRI